MVLKGTTIGSLILDNLSMDKTAGSEIIKEICTDDAKKISDGLSKVAGFPYKEEVYGNVQEIMKTASSCISELIKSLESAQNRNSGLEKAAEVRTIIDEMVKIGTIGEDNAEEKVAELMGKDDSQLSIVKEALKMVQNGKEGNVFFEIDKEASTSSGKIGIFDSVEVG